MTARIDRLWPDPVERLGDDDLVTPLEGLRVNFVASIDGAVTRDGVSGPLGGAADARRFELVRRHADVVLLGAGTARLEGYGPMRVSAESAAWRRARGLSAHPVLALVSSRLDLDPTARMFGEAPMRPIVVTSANPDRDEPGGRRAQLAAVSDLIEAGESEVDLRAAIDRLRRRGLRRILSEGGPELFGSLLAADLVDELLLTVEPTLEAGDAGRITRSAAATPSPMRLAEVLHSDGSLLLRYVRP